MAVYKVPQDVEADDKLIGPFSFRQFVYLIIVVLSIALAWGLWQLFIPLSIIPLPIIVFFGALALPLRKDQPMEIYMAAMVSFYLKPRQRLWDPDGIDSLIEITAPKTIDAPLTKDLTQTEAQRRFSYLAEIVDTQGWAVRGPGVQAPNSAMKSDAYYAAQQVTDVLDDNTTTAQLFSDKLGKSDAERHREMVELLQHPVDKAPAKPKNTNTRREAKDFVNYGDEEPEQSLNYDPYPESIQQSVIEPLGDRNKSTHKPAKTTSEKVVPPGIISLANNSDLTIATIAREANRIQEKQDLRDGTVISLR
ncbi:PrgI family protein [Candidatus Saccharibacteria bacterium]|nr:PrgI family protein [Candidatus Saccharibacteria bacterium]